MKEEALIWFNQGEEHFSDAIFMYENRRYSGAVFFCHQALEKITLIIENINILQKKRLNQLLKVLKKYIYG